MLFAKVENVELQCHISKSEPHNPILIVDDCIEVAKNGLPSIMGT